MMTVISGLNRGKNLVRKSLNSKCNLKRFKILLRQQTLFLYKLLAITYAKVDFFAGLTTIGGDFPRWLEMQVNKYVLACVSNRFLHVNEAGKV